MVPTIDPVAINIAGFGLRWYAVAYILGFIFGFWLLKKLGPSVGINGDKKFWDDTWVYGILGVILGGRLGYCLFYNLDYFITHPLEIFAIWSGGMSFHGGAIGVLISVFLFAHIKKINALSLLDISAVVVPIGLFLGRIANFINMEVMGRVTDKPWGIVFEQFPNAEPRHASPLYEAGLEGIVLFIIMLFVFYKTNLKKTPGRVASVFVLAYAAFRIFAEQFREPDIQIGYLTSWGLTMGQLLSGVMIAVGIILWFGYDIKKRLARK